MSHQRYVQPNAPTASSSARGVKGSNHKIIDRQSLKIMLERNPDLKRHVKEKHLQKLMAIDTLFENEKRNIPISLEEHRDNEEQEWDESEQEGAEEEDQKPVLPHPELDLTPEMLPLLQTWNPAVLQELLGKALTRFTKNKKETTQLFDRSRTKGLSAKTLAHVKQLASGAFQSRQGGTNRIPRKKPVQSNALFERAQIERYRAHRDLRKRMRPSELAAIDQSRRHYL